MELLVQRLMARDFDRQIAGVHVRIAVLNVYTALAYPAQNPWDKSVQGKGEPRS